MAAIPASGSLRETPLPKLLLALYRGRFNGSLRLTRDRLEKTFLFQEGHGDAYSEAEFAELRVSEDGTVALVDLRGAELAEIEVPE